MKNKLFAVWFLFLAGILYSAGEEATGNAVLLKKKNGNIKIDGRLDDAGWRGRMTADKFYKSKKLGLPKYQTEVYVTWDDENLYVGAKLYDEDIVANYVLRDEPIYNEDVFEIFIRPDLTKNFIF
ncbi:MAG: carbohydrate-binding family 9-like protein, partial [Victivallaceae bacterium]